jgi:hypothetical protein
MFSYGNEIVSLDHMEAHGPRVLIGAKKETVKGG